MAKKIEDITSKEYLDEVLKNAKSWCKNNLKKFLYNFQNGIDYDIFHYVIDNQMIGSDMRLDNEEHGLIRVSTEKLKWYLKREEFFGKNKIREPVEIDPESIFVHEISEWIILNKFRLLNQPGYVTNALGFHRAAREIENINRMGRNLKKWPD